MAHAKDDREQRHSRAWLPFVRPDDNLIEIAKSELFRPASIERATTLLNQSAALRSLMLLSGENGVGKSDLAGRWLRSLEPKAYFPVCITQASLTGIGLGRFRG
jgi:MoxR-like ATPase